MQNQFKGCIFQCATTQGLSKTSKVSVRRKLVQVPLSLFLTGPSTKSFYQIIKSSSVSAEVFDDSSNNILGWFCDFWEYFGGTTYDMRLCDFPSPPRCCEKFQEMYFGTNSGDRISGYDCKFTNNVSVCTFRNSEENKESVSRSVQNARQNC